LRRNVSDGWGSDQFRRLLLTVVTTSAATNLTKAEMLQRFWGS